MRSTQEQELIVWIGAAPLFERCYGHIREALNTWFLQAGCTVLAPGSSSEPYSWNA